MTDRVGSGSATERKTGLQDLEYLFRFNRNNHVIDAFTDKTWHSIYETLLKCARTERSTYLNASESQKTRAAPRLAACGRALRTTVAAGVKKIRKKTTKALVEHILQILPVREGSKAYCAGLSSDYVKSLRTILEYQPHVEHFEGSQWHEVLDFCLEGVAPLAETGDDEHDSDDEMPATAGASMRTPSAISLTRRSRVGTSQAQRAQRAPVFRKEVDDLIACVHQLVRATNAPVAQNEINVVNAMQKFLSLSDSVRTSYNDAFSAINAVLYRTSSTSVQLTQHIVATLIPLVKDLWSRKSASLRDEMLVTLVLSKDHVSALAADITQATFRIDLENLLEALQGDYSKRLERDQLHMGDLVLDCTSSSYGKSNLRLPLFALWRGRLRAEGLWSLLYVIASYTAALDKQKLALQGKATTIGNGAPAKRTRLANFLSDDILRHASASPTPATRIANLQYLCFLFQLRPYTSEDVITLLEPLTACTLDANVAVGRWALLALASLAAQISSRENTVRSAWSALVPQIARLLTVDQCSRPASYLLFVLLDLDVLPYGDIADTVVAILDSLELQGPTSINDASLALLGWLMEARAADNPTTATATAERLISWIFQKWSPNSFVDKDLASHLSSTTKPVDIIHALARCRGQSRNGQSSSSPTLCGSIGRAWYAREFTADLTEYLLLQVKETYMATSEKQPTPESASAAAKPALSASVLIVDGLEAELSRTLEAWERIAADRPQSLLPDMITTVLGLAIVSTAIIDQSDERIARRMEGIRRKTDGLLKAVMNVLSHSDCEVERVDVALIAVADYLPIFSTEIDRANYSNDWASLCVRLSSALRQRKDAKTNPATSQEDMDIDMGFESQHSEVLESAASESSHRDIVCLSTDQASFRRQITAQVSSKAQFRGIVRAKFPRLV